MLGFSSPGRLLRIGAVVLSIGCCTVAAAATRAAELRNPAAGLGLAQRDVGPEYRANVGLTGTRTLSDAGQGDSRAVQKELSRSWIGGMENAFNGVSVPWGIVSLVDLFRGSARMSLILKSWENDVVRITGGRRQPIPPGAPGTNGVLVRGHLQSYELLIYMWQHGRTISSVDVTGKAGVPLALLMKLSRRQDAKIAGRA